MTKKLVAYFSASGVTRHAAECIAEEQGADLYEIQPAEPYTSADLNWNDRSSRSSVEMDDPTSRPDLADTNCDIAAYDEIWIGFPIWWYTAPHIILSFLEAYDFSGKTIQPFATSGGSGFGATNNDLQASAPDATFLPGKMASAWA